MTDPAGAFEARYIDLHAHTTASDGSFSPRDLVTLAKQRDLDALAITDHDTFDGFEDAAPLANEIGIELVRGIELNTKLDVAGKRRSAHLLGYWPLEHPSVQFRQRLEDERAERRNRNERLARALAMRGIDIKLEDVERIGRSLAGRVHFARLLVEKGYARNHEDAFKRYLGEDAPSYVERDSQATEAAIHSIRTGGGVPVLAHPVRLSLDRETELKALRKLAVAGLVGLEIYHSEHPPELQAHYRQLAEDFGLLPTGGSDFHGTPKPDIELGTGMKGNVRVPREFLDRMRKFVQ